MYKESEILVAVLETLFARNIPAASGLHDGVLVAALKKLMRFRSRHDRQGQGRSQGGLIPSKRKSSDDVCIYISISTWRRGLSAELTTLALFRAPEHHRRGRPSFH